MRLRNIPRAQEEIDANPIAVKEEKKYRGNWNTVFENEQPIHIEIGMGKGQFILELAKQNPDKNYIGIERYSSVLLRRWKNMIRKNTGNFRISVHLYGCGRASGSIRAGRSRKNLLEFFRSMAESPPRKT